ncbi:MAG TPA: hypothetical protein VGO56_22110 [Pyrinomonadaceae bacterium]|jgi:hypothetical protein|nr:hypothetical protein [Pyrinomonadaceae bacterium]
MVESHQDEQFAEPKSSTGLKVVAALSALLITALVFTGYTLLRKRHAQDSGSLSALSPASPAEPAKPPKALIIVDEALLQGGKSTLGGIVKNTSAEKLEALAVELELKRRKDGVIEKKLVLVDPGLLESQQEGRYILEIRAQDYSYARLVGLKAGPNSSPLAYTTAAGQKRPPERLEPKTIIVVKPAGKGNGFLNSPDNPARVP